MLRVTGLCVAGEFPVQIAIYAENVSIWWRHHGIYKSSGIWMSKLSNDRTCDLKHIVFGGFVQKRRNLIANALVTYFLH